MVYVSTLTYDMQLKRKPKKNLFVMIHTPKMLIFRSIHTIKLSLQNTENDKGQLFTMHLRHSKHAHHRKCSTISLYLQEKLKNGLILKNQKPQISILLNLPIITTSNTFSSSSKVVFPQPLKVAQTTLAASRMSTQALER